jgi:RNA polymerase primary sigma factor
MSDSVKQYLNEIGLVPLLTAEEERELSQTIERGREAQARLYAGERSRALRQAVTDARLARHRFIRANLRLVVSIARRYPRPASMELLDLIQEGNLGLEHAVDKFDWRKGLKFSTYGTYWIRQAVGRALNQKASLIRLPDDAASSLHAALRQASGDADQLDDVHGRLHRLITPTSLDRPVGADDGIDLSHMLAADVPSPEGVLVEREAREMLQDLLATLPARTRLAVEQRFGLADGRKRSYREVGQQLGITAEAARRVVKRAIDLVRQDAVAHTPERPACPPVTTTPSSPR